MKSFFGKRIELLLLTERGFTLIEILIILLLLGILAAVLIPNLTRFTGSGILGTANAELGVVRTAIGAYQSQNNQQHPCTTQPTEDDNQPIDNTLISPYYVTGSIKAVYYINITGNIVDGDNGTWPDTIFFNTTSLKWERSLVE